VSNVPSLRVRSAKFRTGTSSHDQNQMTEELLYDMNNLFNLVNEQETLLEDVKQNLSVENRYQSIRIGNMQAELDDIRALYQQLQAGTGKYKRSVHVNSFLEDQASSPQEKAEIDTYHSLLTLPVTGKTQSKIYLYDDIAKEVVLPSTLKVQVTPEADGVSIIDNDVLNAFSGDNANIWARKYVFPMDEYVDSVTTTVVITLPDNIISNRDINTITVHPFPLSTVDIDSIEYRMDGGWNLIPGWPKDSVDRPLSIQDAGNMKFCFESLPMSEVRITFTQKNFIVEDHKRVFYVGAQEIGVMYTDYQSSIGRFHVPVKLEANAPTRLITKVTPRFKNGEALSDKTEQKQNLFSYAIYTVDETGVLQYTRDTLPIMTTADNLLIKCSVYKDPKTGATPTLESVEVQYEDLV
jgi:hypothetical protein